MTNTQKLIDRIRELNYKQSDLAKRLGIKQSSLSLKIHNKRPFYVDEALTLAKALQIRDDEIGLYFF
ncbi:MAG: helix-turn-helix transcriptional regulator [Oscillospiraceae bacterium]|nr:helix-turn-helix transcriptional regulator [Oscillospiraceae bacterium]